MAKVRSAMASSGPVGLLPVGTIVLMAIIMLLPIGTGASGVIMPHLAMISVFYWLSTRPLLVPYGACAGLGFFLDLWLDVPLGLNMVLLLLTRLFVLNQLKHYKGRNRLVQWIVFAVMSFGLYGISWIIVSILGGQFWPLNPVVFQWLVTTFSYAPVAFLLGRVRRWAL